MLTGPLTFPVKICEVIETQFEERGETVGFVFEVNDPLH